MKNDLFIYLYDASENLDDATDEMWFELMRSSVAMYNKLNETHLDPHDTVLKFIRESNRRINK